MWFVFFIIPLLISGVFFYLFVKGKERTSPLWLMLSVWGVAIGVPRLNLSEIELPWSALFLAYVLISLLSFTIGYFVFDRLFRKYPFWKKISWLNQESFSVPRLRVVIYGLFILSALGLFMFYSRVHNFPLLAPNPDVFRFSADDQVPGLINYIAQLGRLGIPLAFFLMFSERFDFKKHWDLILLCIFGAISLTLFASRTQIFFIDLWVMALYFLIRKPNWRQAIKFYPIFLLISVFVLAAVPIIRQQRSYGESYLGDITGIDTKKYFAGTKYVLPIYVGISFNMQALMHAQDYYHQNPLQHGKVTLDPFTNILGIDSLKSDYDLGKIFFSWWNTGTYLFPFVQDFGDSAFVFVPFLIAGLLTMAWWYWKTVPNFLSINLYAYACFFIVMSIYLSFTVRAEMYIDLFILFISYFFIKTKARELL